MENGAKNFSNSGLIEKFEDELTDSLKTSFINGDIESSEDLRLQLLVNNYKKGTKVITHIINELSKCDEFAFSIAFITQEGINMLLNIFDELRQKGVRGRILTTNYLQFNEPRAFRKLLSFSNIETRVIDDENFHAKGYIFKKSEHFKIIVGSSNMTAQALTKNNEWNIKLSTTNKGDFLQNIIKEFSDSWRRAKPLSEEWINEYEIIFKESKKLRSREELEELIVPDIITPNKMQKEALDNLTDIRKNGKNRALLISATGTGKTFLSAFDAKAYNPKRLLFIVHREQIAKSAMHSFRRIFHDDSKNMGIISGTQKDYTADFIFATMQSLALDEVLQNFQPDDFEYIIIDEVHRAGAPSYQKILNYFQPKFLLGMTATPDRTDNYNIYKLFDYTIAYEIRLQKALEEDMLCPFHYYGVSEIKVNDALIDDTTAFNMLVSEQRVSHIIDKINFYGYSGNRVKGLIFCSRNTEAEDLSKMFNERGFKTVALSGKNSQAEREDAVRKLRSNSGDTLDYIFMVDIFNEGLDIPEVNQIIMLRPTQSAIIFVQQLGRGLRKNPEKDYLIVIDFIGNYSNNFLIPLALSGDRTYNKDTLRHYLMEGTNLLPGASTIMFDKISQQKIYEAINKVRFSQVRQIKEEYEKLKNKIGRIPTISDFYTFGAIDPQIIFNTFGNYYKLLSAAQESIAHNITTLQDQILSFISLNITDAKRPHELVILKLLLEQESVNIKDILATLNNEYNISDDNDSVISAINFLQGRFLVQNDHNKYGDGCGLVEVGDTSVRRTKVLSDSLDVHFYETLKDLLHYAELLYRNEYTNRYRRTNLVLNQKYSRRDVCRLLNWGHDDSSTMYGYRIKHNTCPIFVTYKKELDIVESIKYEDQFINRNTFSWMTRNNVKTNSPEAVAIRNAARDNLSIHLFVKRSDGEGRDFYYLGEVVPIRDQESQIKNNAGQSLPVVNFIFKLKDEVREDIYDYLTK